MPLFTIDRGQLRLPAPESQLLALKALLCSAFYPGMQWIRSFYDESDGLTRCFYVAKTAADIEYHAAILGHPWPAVRPVTEVRPGSGGPVVGGVDAGRDPEAADPALLTWVVRQRLQARDDREVARVPWQPAGAGAGWLRTFIDREADELFSAYREYTRDGAALRAEASGFETIEVRRMDQVLPADIAAANGIPAGLFGTAGVDAPPAGEAAASTAPAPGR